MLDFDRKAYALNELERVLATLGPEARILMDNLPYSAVLGWPFIREDGSAGMQTRVLVWRGSFAIALDHETHQVIVVEQIRESPNGPTTTVEIPGGGIDPGTEPLDQAIAELAEETGAVQNDDAEWIRIGRADGFTPLDGIVWTNQHAFLCTSVHFVAEPETGIRKVTTYPLSKLIEMDNKDAFQDPFSPYIIRRVQDWLAKNHPELLT